jgi:hypothetical protein
MGTITGFRLILSLISLFRQKRGQRESVKKEDFYAWLIEHKFQDVKDVITETFGMEIQIETLLQMNQEQLLARFDEVDQKLFCIMNSMQEFRSLIKIVAPQSILSEQEESILRQFVDSGDYVLIDTSGCSNPISWSTNRGIEIKVKEIRYLNSNLQRLVALGFLLEGFNGHTNYELTGDGIEYVNNLKKSMLSKQEESILRQIVESGEYSVFVSEEEFVTKVPSGQIESIWIPDLSLSIIKQPIMVNDRNFIKGNLNKLVNAGFLTTDDNKNFTITEDAVAYVKAKT